MIFAACAITLLCLASVSHSAPLTCEELVRPLDQLDPHHLQGRWVLVAGSQKDTAPEDILKGRDSVTIDIHNSSYTQAASVGGICKHHPRNFSLEGHIFTSKVRTFNFTGTLFRTSCPDCMLLTFEVESPNYSSVEFFLFSRRREVDQEQLEEFRAQVKCLKMPPPAVMDPTKELCPEHPAGQPAAQTAEKAGEEA